MTAISKVSCGRLALCVTLLACACERDSAALFDDSVLDGPSGGGSGPAAAGSSGTPAISDGGEDAAGGAETAGSSSDGGKGGSAAGSDAGGSTAGGAGTAGSAGKPTAGEGGSAGSVAGMGGGGGTKPDPEPDPVKVVITQFDDAHIASCMPYSNFGSLTTLNVDYDNSCVYQALLAPSLEMIPPGALVSEAILTLDCVNEGGTVSLSYVEAAWKENEVRYMGRPEVGTGLGSLTCEKDGPVTFDLTVAVEAWVRKEHAAHGIYLRTDSQDGTDFASSEAQNAEMRPSLTVTYTLPKK